MSISAGEIKEMKKGLTIFLISIFVLAFSITNFGQKTKTFNSKNESKKINSTFVATQAFTDGSGVFVQWQMGVEHNNIGFNVYRMDGLQKIRVNPNLISGGFVRNGDENVFGFSYSFFDPTGSFGASYIVETLDLAGQSIASKYIFPTFVKDITPIAGLSSEVMIKASGQKNNLIEKDEPILPKELDIEISQNSLPPDIDKQKFIASQPGVKIRVNKEGVYRVTRTELENAGFDVNATSDNWQLYVNGVEQAFILGESDAYIEFYGKGVDTNETDLQNYFLINGATSGKRIGTSVRRRIGGTVISESFDTSALKQDRIFYLQNVRNGDDNNWVSDKIINSTGVTVNFDVNDIDFSQVKTKMVVTAQGLTLLPHTIGVTLNGEFLGNLTGNNHDSMSETFEIPTSLLTEGSNSIFFKTPDGSTDISFVESILVNYKKFYKTRQNALSFYTNPQRASTLTGFTSSNIRVFDITYPDHPSVIRNLNISEDNGDFGVHLPANRSRRMYAVEDSAVLSAVSIIQNNPSTLSTINHNADFIVISYRDWMTEANNWANYRINEGFTAEVVDVEDIYDEFNFGVLSANSIRDFLQYAKGNWQTPPNYVLLLGDTTYDPRDYENRGNTNYMPVKMVDTLYEETGSDEAMADFNKDGLADLAIGRVATKDAATVTLVLNKVINFENAIATGLDRGVLFASDCPNGYDFSGLSQRLANELPSGTNYVKVDRCDTSTVPRDDLLNELNTGRFLVNYSGHGSTGLWAATSFYSIFDVPTISNGNDLSIFTMLTCLNGYFLRTNANSLSEELLHSPNGGGVVVWSSTGKTTPDVQEVMAKKFYQNISDTNIERLGDSINISKQNIVGGRDVRLSWALLGDPMLKIR